MPNITLKNVPNEVHKRLKEQAERHRRSMNREAIWILERALCPTPRDAEAVIAEAEALNRDIGQTFPVLVNEAEEVENTQARTATRYAHPSGRVSRFRIQPTSVQARCRTAPPRAIRHSTIAPVPHTS